MTNENKSRSFFSGIGLPEKALERLKNEGYIKDYKVEFFSEIDKNVIKSYYAIHNIDKSLNLGSITNIKGKDFYNSLSFIIMDLFYIKMNISLYFVFGLIIILGIFFQMKASAL